MKPSTLRRGDQVIRPDFKQPLEFVNRDSRTRINVFICPNLVSKDDRGYVTMPDTDVIRYCSRTTGV